jgi:predicted RNase H-like nuclease
MFFVGIDLAWSKKNCTGIAIIEGNAECAELCGKPKTVSSDDDIVNYIKEFVGDDNAFIAIDAPLIVPNENGNRKAEQRINELFRGYGAIAYPSNRRLLLQYSEKIRGEELSKILEKEKFKQNPSIKQFEEERNFFEIYPHSSMIALFNLKEIIRYKKKQKRDYGFRWGEFEKYQCCLKKLSEENPSLKLPEDIVEKKVKGMKGKRLKKYEDILDAIFCAYVAYYYWVHPQKCKILGDMSQGYIVTIFPRYARYDPESVLNN